jgi:hypothetical protein
VLFENSTQLQKCSSFSSSQVIVDKIPKTN